MEQETIKLYRYRQSGEFHGKILTFLFRDEFGKTTRAKYKLIRLLLSNINDLNNYLWKLDARSIRYMRRVEVVENKREEAKHWKH